MNSRRSKPMLCAGLACVIAAMPLALAGCKTRKDTDKTTTTKVKETPEGTKVTTEKKETTVETTPKNP